jgi:HAMP domain-containing protein
MAFLAGLEPASMVGWLILLFGLAIVGMVAAFFASVWLSRRTRHRAEMRENMYRRLAEMTELPAPRKRR